MSRWSEYFYNRLPKIYREYDEELQLKNYLEAVFEDGFDKVLEETENVFDLVNPETCPTKYLPYLCERYGIKYFHDIPEIFQRRFLQNVVVLQRKKGTKTAITFMARELSGFNTEIGEDEEGYLVRLIAFEENAELLLAQDVIARYLEQFIPVGINARVVVSYGFLDEKIFTSEDNEGDYNITDDMLQERFDETEEEIDINIEIDVEDENTMVKELSGITNVAVTNKTFYTNMLNGTDVLIVDEVETIITY